MWDAYVRMSAYKCDVVVVIKMGAYIHGVLILCGCIIQISRYVPVFNSNLYNGRQASI